MKLTAKHWDRETNKELGTRVRRAVDLITNDNKTHTKSTERRRGEWKHTEGTADTNELNTLNTRLSK